jgi:Arc/MetJ-type ribon-helix-helix transcriptional regulator
MSVDIPAEFAPFVTALIESGQFHDERAVVARALQVLRSFQDAEESVKRDVLHGFEQLDRGESVTGEVALDRLKKRLAGLASERE